MAEDDVKEKEKDSGSFDRNSILNQVKSELVKQGKDALKGKLKNLLQKRTEAMRAVAVIDKEIEDELNKFEQGLA